MQDEIQDVWAKFLRESLKNVTDDELTMLDELSNGRNDPAEIVEHIFTAIETEMQRRMGWRA